jgi:YHS domain-containing protein
MKLIMMVIAMLSLAQVAWAADPDIYSHKRKGAIGGVDVVAYHSLPAGAKAVKGDKNFSHRYKDATWYFSTQENREIFVANPEKYAPQYGGYCAFAVSHGFTKKVDPNAWEIVDDKLYLNLNKRVKKKWLKDRDGFIERANANWPLVLQACEEHDNCRKPAS